MVDNENDWLSKEVERERKRSFWDLDEPNKIRKLHEENCSREKLRKEHLKVHEGNKKETKEYNTTSDDDIKQKKIINTIAWFFVVFFLLMLMNFR